MGKDKIFMRPPKKEVGGNAKLKFIFTWPNGPLLGTVEMLSYFSLLILNRLRREGHSVCILSFCDYKCIKESEMHN